MRDSKPNEPTQSEAMANVNIHIHTPVSRKNAYVAAAKPKTLVEWATEILDAAANYQEPK